MNNSRRRVLDSIVLGGIGLFLAGTCSLYASDRTVPAAAQDAPNIVIVLTDDLGYGDVSFLNAQSKIQTPEMDALASQGVWATDAHSPSAVCSPTRYALLTGRYAWRGQKRIRRGVLMPWDEPAIEVGRLTLPGLLKTKGYTTACIGKWHLGFTWPWKGGKKPHPSIIGRSRSTATSDLFDWSQPITGGPLAAGFDYYFGDDVPNFPPYAFIENEHLTCTPVDIVEKTMKSLGKRGSIHGSGPGEEGWTFEKVMPEITRRAADYIHQHSKKPQPYFLLFSTTSPHSPVVPTKEFQGRSEAGSYGDYVIQTDDAVGQIVQALKASGTYENTLLIVTSDNGPSPMHRDLIRTHQHDPAGHLRGMKWDAWEGGHRVPFIASWPKGDLSGGRRIDAILSLTDLFATLAAIVDAPLEENSGEDSLNILSSLRENKSIRTEMVYHAGSGDLGLRQGNWAYLRMGGKKEPDWYTQKLEIEATDAPGLLFNLSADAGEKVNLYHQQAERVKAMETKLTEIEQAESSR